MGVPNLLPPFPDVPVAPGAPACLTGSASQITAVQTVLNTASNSIGAAQNLLTAAGNPYPDAFAALTNATGSLGLAAQGIGSGISQVQNVQANLTSALFGTNGANNEIGGAVAGVSSLLNSAIGGMSQVANALTGALNPFAAAPQTLTGDSASLPPGASSQQWGVYDSSMNPVATADSVFAVEVGLESDTAEYPVEGGDFESYNKVTVPYRIIVTMTKGGSEGERAAFILALEAAKASLNLYTVMTPEQSYSNGNIIATKYRRSAEAGAGLLKVDVTVKEVRVAASGQLSNTQAPSGADPVNGGTVQASPLTATQTAQTAGGAT